MNEDDILFVFVEMALPLRGPDALPGQRPLPISSFAPEKRPPGDAANESWLESESEESAAVASAAAAP